MPIVTLALDHQRIEHPLLMRIRPHVEIGEGNRRDLPERSAVVPC